MTYLFDGYTVRPVTEKDRTYLDIVIQQDEFHQGRMTPDFFLKLRPGEDAWALEDEQHNVIFYFKTSTVVRMAIQFTGWHTQEDRKRNQTALMRGFDWIRGIFRANAFTEIICDTESDTLRRFLGRHLGFVSSPTLSNLLTPPGASGSAGKGVNGDVRTIESGNSDIPIPTGLL